MASAAEVARDGSPAGCSFWRGAGNGGPRPGHQADRRGYAAPHPGDVGVRRLVSAAAGLQPGGGLRPARGSLFPLDLFHGGAGGGLRAGPDVAQQPGRRPLPPTGARTGCRRRGRKSDRSGPQLARGRGFPRRGHRRLRWPTFNVADIAVSCGAIALAISLWREDARRPEPESASAA